MLTADRVRAACPRLVVVLTQMWLVERPTLEDAVGVAHVPRIEDLSPVDVDCATTITYLTPVGVSTNMLLNFIIATTLQQAIALGQFLRHSCRLIFRKGKRVNVIIGHMVLDRALDTAVVAEDAL